MSNLPKDRYFCKKDERGFKFVYRAPNDSDFVCGPGTTMREYENARRSGKNVVTLNEDGNVKIGHANFCHNNEHLIDLLEPFPETKNEGVK